MRLQLRSLVAAVAVIFASFSSSRAIDITFNFTSLTTEQPSYILYSGIYDLSLTQPVGSGTTPNQFYTDGDGIWLGEGATGNPPLTFSFDMSITGGSLQFKSYEIGYINGGEVGTFSLIGGTGTSTGNPVAPVGTHTFAGTKIISPGDTITLSGTITSGNLSQLKSLTFSTVTVPEPSTYALAAIATGVMAAVARRRKARKA